MSTECEYEVPEDTSSLNNNFTFTELSVALHTFKGKSAGQDQITYNMIKKISVVK